MEDEKEFVRQDQQDLNYVHGLEISRSFVTLMYKENVQQQIENDNKLQKSKTKLDEEI